MGAEAMLLGKWSMRVAELGAGEILLTSMDGDGTQAGYDLELTELISSSVNIPVIASGGVGNLEHLCDGLKKGKGFYKYLTVPTTVSTNAGYSRCENHIFGSHSLVSK